MATRISNLKVHGSLAIVTVDGFEPGAEVVDGYVVPTTDAPGTANWLVEGYGVSANAKAGDYFDGPGILYTDYSGGGWEFSVLIGGDEVEKFSEFARGSNYDVISVKVIEEPTNYGDEDGTVEILKHRDGWVVMGS